MTEKNGNKSDEDTTLKVKDRQKLSLTKTVESGQVQQTVHGRQKTVQVEVRRTRTFSSNDAGKNPADSEDSSLTDSEREARLSALENAANAPSVDNLPPKAKIEKKPEPEVPVKKSQKKEPEIQAPTSEPKPAEAGGEEAKGSKLVLTGNTRKKGLERDESYQKSSKPKKGEQKRRQGKLTVTQALEDSENGVVVPNLHFNYKM